MSCVPFFLQLNILNQIGTTVSSLPYRSSPVDIRVQISIPPANGNSFFLPSLSGGFSSTFWDVSQTVKNIEDSIIGAGPTELVEFGGRGRIESVDEVLLRLGALVAMPSPGSTRESSPEAGGDDIVEVFESFEPATEISDSSMLGAADFSASLVTIQTSVQAITESLTSFVVNAAAATHFWEVANFISESVTSGTSQVEDADDPFVTEEQIAAAQDLEEKLEKINNAMSQLSKLTPAQMQVFRNAGMVERDRAGGLGSDYSVVRIGDYLYSYEFHPEKEENYGEFVGIITKPAFYTLVETLPGTANVNSAFQGIDFRNGAAFFQTVEIVLTIIPGGSTAASIADGNGALGTTWAFAQDVASAPLVLGRLASISKLGKVGKAISTASKLNPAISPKLLAASIIMIESLSAAENATGAIQDIRTGENVAAAIKSLNALLAVLNVGFTANDLIKSSKLAKTVLVDDIAAPINVPVMRQQYVNAVNGLSKTVAEMRASGNSAEEIARALHAQRRALGVQYKNLTPDELLQQIYERNLAKYGDKLGPTIDYLRNKGKSWEEIIESACRTGGKDLGL